MTVRQKYYPWAVMAACCLFLAAVMGVGTNCNGIFMQPVSRALGVGVGSVSTFITVMGIACAAAAPIVGNIINKVDVRLIMTASSVIAGTAYLFLSRVQNITQYRLAGALVGLGVGFGSFLTVTVILNNWFVKNNGFVIGLTMSASSLAGIVMNPVLGAVIESFGWRKAYLLMGVIIFATLPIIWIFIRTYPSQKNSAPWGEEPGADLGRPSEGGESLTGLPPASDVLRSKSFILVMLFAFVSSFFINHMSHMAGIAEASGLSAATGAVMISCALAGEFTGKLAIGWLSDRFGVLRAVYITGGLGVVSLIGLLCIKQGGTALGLISAYAYGPMTAIGSVGYSLIVKYITGVRLYPRCYPWVSIISTVSFSIGFPVIGYIYDAAGSYAPSFYATLAGLAVSAVLLTTAIRAHDREKV